MISGDRSLAEGKHGAFYNTLEEFHKYWDRIDIICPRPADSITKQVFDNVFIHSSPWPLIFQPWWIYLEGRRILKNGSYFMTVHEYAPFYNGLGAYLLNLTTHALYIIEIMHIPGLPKAGSLKEQVYKWLTEFFIATDVRKARAVRVINQKQTKDFLIHAGVPASKIHYIPAFYINLDIFKPEPADKKYDLVYAARLEKNKGIINLLKAVKIIKKDKPNIKLCLIGDGPMRSELKNFVQEQNLEQDVEFTGWLKGSEDVARIFNQSRIFVNPSLNEGGPRVALEAMACGLPVVTTRVGLMLDIIQDGISGIFVDWSSKDMAKKIFQLLKDEELQSSIQRTGLESVKQFERKSAIKNYADSLCSLI